MGQTAYQVVQDFGHQQYFSKSSKSYKTSQLFESSLLSGEFRFFGPSIHVSSALRLCGNASCELSQGKLLGWEKLCDGRCLLKVHGMHQTYFLTDGFTIFGEMVPKCSKLCFV